MIKSIHFPYGCFFLEEHPENLCKQYEPEMQKKLRSLGYIKGCVCYQLIDGIAHIIIDGKPALWYDLITGEVERDDRNRAEKINSENQKD